MDITNQAVLGKKTTPVIFQGKTSEYFGIWIVNLLLSLITPCFASGIFWDIFYSFALVGGRRLAF